jgi:hypothetical protein
MNRNEMHALLHAVCAVIAVPYVALALFFIFVGQAARAKGVLAVVEVVWNNFYFYFTKGMFIAPLLWGGLVAIGFIPTLQRTASVCLGLLALASLLVIILLSSARLAIGELLFLIPCVVVVATSAWLFFRVGADV